MDIVPLEVQIHLPHQLRSCSASQRPCRTTLALISLLSTAVGQFISLLLLLLTPK